MVPLNAANVQGAAKRITVDILARIARSWTGTQASRSNSGRLPKMEVDMANKRQKTSDAIEIVESVEKELYKKVRAYIAAARAKVYTVANEEMVKAYWNVGR